MPENVILLQINTSGLPVDNIQVSKYLQGEVGLLFTNKTKEEVQE